MKRITLGELIDSDIINYDDGIYINGECQCTALLALKKSAYLDHIVTDIKVDEIYPKCLSIHVKEPGEANEV